MCVWKLDNSLFGLSFLYVLGHFFGLQDTVLPFNAFPAHLNSHKLRFLYSRRFERSLYARILAVKRLTSAGGTSSSSLSRRGSEARSRITFVWKQREVISSLLRWPKLYFWPQSYSVYKSKIASNYSLCLTGGQSWRDPFVHSPSSREKWNDYFYSPQHRFHSFPSSCLLASLSLRLQRRRASASNADPSGPRLKMQGTIFQANQQECAHKTR